MLTLAAIDTTSLAAGGGIVAGTTAILGVVFAFILKFRNGRASRNGRGKDEIARAEIDTLKTVESDQWKAISHIRDDLGEIKGTMARIDERTARLPCLRSDGGWAACRRKEGGE